MRNFVLAFALITSSAQVFSAELKVQKVKELGPMKNTVIYQSTDFKKIKNSNVLKGKLVVQWGLHVYEVVNGLYTCNKNNVCKLTDFERVASYEKCTVKNEKVACRKRLSSSFSSERSSDVSVYDDGPDSTQDEFSRGRSYVNSYNNEYYQIHY